MGILQGADAVATVSGDAYGRREANIVCPACGSDYTHVHRVGTLVGRDEFEATTAYPGTFSSGITQSRRSAVEIVFRCEQCPVLFALVIQQHKGVNLVEVYEDVGDLPASDFALVPLGQPYCEVIVSL